MDGRQRRCNWNEGVPPLKHQVLFTASVVLTTLGAVIILDAIRKQGLSAPNNTAPIYPNPSQVNQTA